MHFFFVFFSVILEYKRAYSSTLKYNQIWGLFFFFFYGGTDGILLSFVGHMQIITQLADAIKRLHI